MRAIFQRSPRVSFLFAGSLDHSMRQIFRPEAPLGGFGGSYALSEIASEEWERGLAERFESASVAIDGVLLTRIVELGSGHPRTTMLIGAEAFGVAQEAGLEELDAGAIDLAWERARSHDAERCRFVVDRVRQLRVAKGADLALRLARALAAGEPPYAVDAHAQQVSRALDSLSDIGIAEQVAPRSWRIADPILRAYLTVGSG